MPRTILMVCFYFPPVQASTGSLRAVSMINHLPTSGWTPHVLTASERAYRTIDRENTSLIGDFANVHRASCLDAQRHLSIRGRYPSILGLPDPWQTWTIPAVIKGLHLCRRIKPDVLFSTYPTPTSHVICLILTKLTGIPWVAEFRDPMVEEDYPSDPLARRLRLRIEHGVARHAARIIVVTEGTAELYRQRYPHRASDIVVIENGYDEGLIAKSSKPTEPLAHSEPGPKVILHSGVLYPHERNPDAFFRAVANLKRRNALDAATVRFRLRGSGDSESAFAMRLKALDIEDLVELAPTVPYAEASSEMNQADGLMVFQGKVCNRQIPAKVYEYLSTRKPILAFADEQGDTWRTLRACGVRHVAPLEDEAAIERAIVAFVQDLEGNVPPGYDIERIRRMSRRERVQDLASVLDDVVHRSAVHG